MTAVRRWQIAFIAAGVVVIGLGGVVLLLDVDPARYVGIALWFAGALVLHDAVVAPIVLGVHLLLRRVGRRIPIAVLLILQGALAVAAMVTAIAVPQILKRGIGSANATILPLDYAGHLVLFHVGLALVTAMAIAAALVIDRRGRSPESDGAIHSAM